MKQCLFKHQWGQHKRWIFNDPPESGSVEGMQLPEVNIQRDLEDLKTSTEMRLDIDESIASGDKERIKKSFIWRVERLNSKYFQPSTIKENRREKYIKTAREFESAMQKGTLEQLEGVWNKKQKAEMEARPLSDEEFKGELLKIKEGLDKTYMGFSGIDKADGVIDLKESKKIMEVHLFGERIRRQDLAENFKMLEERSEKEIKMLEGKSEAEIKLILEAMYYFKPKVWEKTIPLLPNGLFSQAERDANEGAMIALANQMEGSDRFLADDFEAAKNYLTQKMVEAGQIGVSETIGLLRTIENALEPGWNGLQQGASNIDLIEERLNKYSKHSFYWKQLYLRGEVEASNEFEDTLIEFMQASREDRVLILKDDKKRYHLLKAIHLTQTQYKEEYDRYFKTENSKTNEALRKKHGSLGALVLMGEEAKAIVENFKQAPETDQLQLDEKIQKITEEHGRTPQYKRHKKPKIEKGVLSQLEAGGFNGRDLTLGGLKVVAMATFLVNGMNVINSASGDNFFEKIGNGLKDIALLKNPTVALSAAVVYGTRTLQKNKYLFDYFRVGGYEQEGMEISLKLHHMADKINYHKVKNYIHNQAEWRMMADLDHNEVKNILKMARDRRRENKSGVAIVTKQDLKEYIGAETYEKMTDDPTQAHVRYEFLSKFRESSNYLEIHTLKALCIGNGQINN